MVIQLISLESFGITPGAYGRIYKINDYMQASGGDANKAIKRCLTDIAFQAYDNPGIYTVLFPAGTYYINEHLSPVNQGINLSTFWRSSQSMNVPLVINLIGLSIDANALDGNLPASTCPSLFDSWMLANSINNDPAEEYLSYTYTTNGWNGITSQQEAYLNAAIATNAISVANNPASSNFLNISNAVSLRPLIVSESETAHCFFHLKNDATASDLANTTINIMGFHFKGIDQPDPNNANNPLNTHIYHPLSAQHNDDFTACTMLELKKFKQVFVDNNILEDVYGNGVLVDNYDGVLDYLFENGAVEVNSNIIKNVWQLKYKQANGSFDDTGDGITFAGIEGGKSNYNYIVNNVAVTGQNGRIALGTCAEWNKNTEARYNQLAGYDRLIHIENALGGFTIEYNRCTGTETGIVFDSYNDPDLPLNCQANPTYQPSIVRYNYVSNEGVPGEQDAPHLREIYPPHLFYSSGAFESMQYNGSIFQENVFVLDKQKIRNYTTAAQYNPQVFLSSERYHMYSSVRGQKIHCNVFETKHADLFPGIDHSGLFLISNHSNNNIAAVTNSTHPCMVPTGNPYWGDGTTNANNMEHTIPIEMTGNLLVDCYVLRLNGWFSSDNQIFQNTVVNTVLNPVPFYFPSANYFTKSIPGVGLTCNQPNYPLTYFNWSAQSQFTNPACANANSGSIHYVIVNNPAAAVTYTLNPGNVQNSTGLFNNLSAGTYTINAADAVNTTSTVVILTDPGSGNFCCLAAGPNLVSTPNVNMRLTPSASGMIAEFGSNVIANRLFYIDGIFTINDNIEFVNCTLWFTPSGQVVLNGPYNFAVNQSTLQASCDWWGGIVANDAQQKVKIENGSHIKNAVIGVHASNNALLEASDSYFEDNGQASVFFQDITAPAYAGYVHHNQFSSAANLPAPYPKTQYGIVVGSANHLEIGDYGNPAAPNTFDGMGSGIAIFQTQQSGTAHVHLYNNRFSNIHATVPANFSVTPAQYVVDQCYQQANGSGIYIHSGIAGNQFNFTSNILVDCASGFVGNSFSDCDKGVVSVATQSTVSNQTMDECVLGIMCHSLFKRNYILNGNHISGAHIGIELFGREQYSEIWDNVISLNKVVLSQVGPVSTTPPVGIKFQRGQLAFAPIPQFFINGNTVTLQTMTGAGIQNSFGDIQTQTKGNTIHFTTNQTGSSEGSKLRQLIGVWANRCTDADFDDNNTHGFSNPTLYDARNSYGHYLDNSPWCRWHCNKADHTQFGFYTWGNSETSADKVTYNRMDFNEWPWWFLDGPASEPGSLGLLIGDNSIGGTEPANEFFNVAGIGTLGLNTMSYSVYRGSSIINFQGKIQSNSGFIDQAASGALVGGAEYVINNNSNLFSNPCLNNSINVEPAEDPSNEAYGQYIEAVISDSIAYINYNEVAGWLDRYRVYRDLDMDSLLRYSDPSLLNFYDTLRTGNIGLLRAAEKAIDLLYDSSTHAGNFSARYQAAWDANNNISSGEEWEEYEKVVNEAMILLTQTPPDSLPQVLKEEIGMIAHLCPYVGGHATRKARTLYLYWQPNALWDDRVICLQGQNKGSTASVSDLDSIYMAQVRAMNQQQIDYSGGVKESVRFNKSAVFENSSVSVYPNPAQSFITVQTNYNTTGYFTLYNSLGQVVIKTLLQTGRASTQIPLLDLTSGIYHYEIDFAGSLSSIGKLSIYK